MRKLSLTVDASPKTFLPLGASCVAALWESWFASSKLVLFLLSERNQINRGVSTWEAVPTLTVISSAIIAQWHKGHPQPNLLFFLFFCQEDFLIPEISPIAKWYGQITWSEVLIASGIQDSVKADLLLKSGLRKSCSFPQKASSIHNIILISTLSVIWFHIYIQSIM